MLNKCFTEQSVTAISSFVSQHIDRWHQILLEAHDSTTEWSASIGFEKQMDHPVFDIMGYLSFGRSFDIKEPGDNPLSRQGVFYFLWGGQDPSTFGPLHTEDELRAEATLLIVAGSDTTRTALSSIVWYLVRAPRCYRKLIDEFQKAFKATEDVVYGPALMNCTYLRTCIDEGMRLVPAGTCEPPRQVLAGGIDILNDHYPEGTVVGTVRWCDSNNGDAYGDPGVFRPEGRIENEAAGVTKAMVAVRVGA
ncbi:cytochrome p450 family protein [Paraphaeosphaeria sporulosa]